MRFLPTLCLLASAYAFTVPGPAIQPLRIGAYLSPSSLGGPEASRSRGGGIKLQMSSSLANEEPKKQGFLAKLKSSVPPANERKKLLPLGLIFFCILFNYTILRDTKDVLMVTAKGSGTSFFIIFIGHLYVDNGV